MGNTADFFENKREWSKIKDSILDYYLKPYISKIIFTRKPLTIMDCFAGKGKFDDGNNGSPVIISEKIKSNFNNRYYVDINGVFIEKVYFKDLKRNLEEYEFSEVWEGTFEDNFIKLLNLDSNRNVFLYVDPYGIKSLDFNRFRKIKDMGFNSLEMLLNFNSIGFFREGFRLLKYEDLIEQDTSDIEYEYDMTNNIENMNRIANGKYWQDILRDCKNSKITTYNAEELFVEGYVKQLKILFKHVVNIPIKIKTKNIPKYRMIFCTNSIDGLTLMNDNMHKKWKEILETQRGGQQAIFEFDFPGFYKYDYSDISKDIAEILRKEKKSILLQDLFVKLIEKNGISFLIKDYKNIITEMGKSKIILINHNPPRTPSRRQKATALDYKKYIISLRLIND